MFYSKILCLILGMVFAGGANPYADCSISKKKQGLCVPQSECPNDFNSLRCSQSNNGEEFVCCNNRANKNGLKKLKNMDTCGLFNENKIRGGTEVQIHSRPWMALLFYKLHYKSKKIPKCGGSLITDRFVLTAAHCFYIPSYNLALVRLGEHNWKKDKYLKNGIYEKNYKNFGIEMKITHERFNNFTIENDIGLIKLDKSVVFEAHILPICLPLNRKQRKDARNQQIYLVAGWGLYNDNNEMSDVLREAKLNRLDEEECLIWYLSKRKKQLCVGSKDMDSSRGDSGSPLCWPNLYYNNQRMIQYGIVSYGYNISLPGVYTNIASYIAWISRNVVD